MPKVPPVLVGAVLKFDLFKGYGFAELGSGEHVLLHQAVCRGFATGTPEEPAIESEIKNDRGWIVNHVIPKNTSLNYAHVAIQLTSSGTDRLRASRWAIIPRRRTWQNVLALGGLNYYVGKRIEIHSPERSSDGWLQAWSLTECQLMLEFSRGVRHEIEFAEFEVRADDLEKLVFKITQTIEDDTLNDETATDPSETIEVVERKTRTIEVVCWR